MSWATTTTIEIGSKYGSTTVLEEAPIPGERQVRMVGEELAEHRAIPPEWVDDLLYCGAHPSQPDEELDEQNPRRHVETWSDEGADHLAGSRTFLRLCRCEQWSEWG